MAGEQTGRGCCGKLLSSHQVQKAIALHPQVVIERDKALAALGSETLDERGAGSTPSRLSMTNGCRTARDLVD